MPIRGIVVIIGSVVIASTVPEFAGIESREVRNCLSLLLLVSTWWIVEPFPSYVTSLAVVPLSVGLKIIDSKAAAAAFFDPVMFLFISGFTFAAAMDKYQITRRLSGPFIKKIVSWSNKRGGDIIFYIGISLLCVLLSALVSNVAAAVLVASIGKSVASSLVMDTKAQKRLYLTIAFACNVGGMVVPIASPQNMIALSALRSVGNIKMTFFEWLQFSVPLCAFALILIYIVLRYRYGVSQLSHGYENPMTVIHHKRFDDSDEEGEEAQVISVWGQIVVGGVVGIIVIGWCFFEQLKMEIFLGHMGILGLVGVVILHALGLCNQSDWQSLPWPVLTLLGGGLVLGESVERSGLLSTMVEIFLGDDNGTSSGYYLFIILLGGVGLIANFLSSTVCALITLPVIAKVGLSVGHPRLFVVAAALMTSGAMALPVSSFPNANSASVKDSYGNQLLRISDFTKSGFPVATIFFISLISLGYFYGTSLSL
jgi:phosphate transporter